MVVASLVEKVCVEASDEGIDLKCLDSSCEEVTFSIALQKTIDYICELTGAQIKSEADLYCLNNESECENIYTLDYSIMETKEDYKLIYKTDLIDLDSSTVTLIKNNGERLVGLPYTGSTITGIDKNWLPIILNISGTKLQEDISKNIYISELIPGSYCEEFDCTNFNNNTKSDLTVDDKISILAKHACKSEKKKTYTVTTCSGEKIEYSLEAILKHTFSKSCPNIYIQKVCEIDNCTNLKGEEEVTIQDFITQQSEKCCDYDIKITALEERINELQDLVMQLSVVEPVVEDESTENDPTQEICYEIIANGPEGVNCSYKVTFTYTLNGETMTKTYSTFISGNQTYNECLTGASNLNVSIETIEDIDTISDCQQGTVIIN